MINGSNKKTTRFVSPPFFGGAKIISQRKINLKTCLVWLPQKTFHAADGTTKSSNRLRIIFSRPSSWGVSHPTVYVPLSWCQESVPRYARIRQKTFFRVSSSLPHGGYPRGQNSEKTSSGDSSSSEPREFNLDLLTEVNYTSIVGFEMLVPHLIIYCE